MTKIMAVALSVSPSPHQHLFGFAYLHHMLNELLSFPTLKHLTTKIIFI